MHRLLLLSILTLTGAALLVDSATTRTADATFVGMNGQIAFISTRLYSDQHVWAMNDDGGGEVFLTRDELGMAHEQPIWSPDGSRIVYVREAGGPAGGTTDGDLEIITRRADGTGPRQLTNNDEYDFEPTWSPDGDRIAFVSSRINGRDIYVMNADGTQQDRITQDPASDEDPTWSPHGKKIAFVRRAYDEQMGDDSYNVFVVAMDGSEQPLTTFAPGGPTIYRLDWSPEGSKLALAIGHPRAIRIATISVETGELQYLTPDEMTIWYPTWSPDGSKIAFAATNDIWVVNADGTGRTNITDSPQSELTFAWSPDSTELAFGQTNDGNTDIFTIGIDGTNQQRLTDDLSTDYYPDWQALMIGDVNCRDSLNSIDAALVLQFAASLLKSLPCQDLGEVDRSGMIDSLDAALILQYGAGLLDHL